MPTDVQLSAGSSAPTATLDEARESLRALEEELSLVYSIDEKLHGPAFRHSGLAQLVGLSGRFLAVAYSVLLLPSKHIRISATRSSWKEVDRRAVDRYIVETLFTKLSSVNEPVIFDIAEVSSVGASEDRQQVLLSPLRSTKGELEGVIAQFGRASGMKFRDSHKRFMAHIVRRAETVIEQSFDPMTGLMNHGGFEAQLMESGTSLTAAADPHQLIYFDIDNLQLVNDTFGRDAGDEVIRRFASVLESSLPRNAVASRLSGDSFGILIVHTKLDDALRVANAVRAQSQRMRYLQGSKSLQVTVSIGVASFDQPEAEGEALTAARIACDAAKDRGRDRIEVHDQDDQSIIRRYDDMQLVTKIQQALDRDEFALFAQPIARAGNKPAPIDRYEILIRMSESGSNVGSAAFISTAERYYLMPQIDRWVISSTIRAIVPFASTLRAGDMRFAINLSGQSLGDKEMLAFILNELDTSGIPPECLSFEITESAAVSNIDNAQALIASLRQHGCRFSLDDFGAGLSSFAYLKNLDVDTLKIDGGFIRGLAADKISQSMVAAITQVAKVMELDTVAEFVEKEELDELLTSLGVTYLQGHFIGRPVPLGDVLDSIVEARKTA